MRNYDSFIFKSYKFEAESKTLILVYGFDNELEFTETYKFNFDFAPEVHSGLLEVALQSLFYMAGVSYFKAYLPKNIVTNSAAPLDETSAGFFSKTYQKGLGEFFYVNGLDPKTPIIFQPNSDGVQPVQFHDLHGQLVGIGGGKDSLVSVELLKNHRDISTWSADHQQQLSPLVNRIGLNHFWVERRWDRKLMEHSAAGAYNGHIPISAIWACVGLVVAVLSGSKDIIVSNESSASEPNLVFQDAEINHQYSKSLEFETDFQDYLKNRVGESLQYYSFLRPLSELRITEIFAGLGYEKYKDVFSSCNRAFTHSSHKMFWCGQCPKCAFIFLALTPFLSREKVEYLWHGKNLLLDPKLEKTYMELLGIARHKPLDCVGEVKETRSAMRLAQKVYPELNKYQFFLPEDYDFRTISKSSMPDDMFKLLLAELQ